MYAAAKDMAYTDVSPRRAKVLCNTAPQGMRDYCWEGVGGILGSLDSETAKRKARCDNATYQVPARPATAALQSSASGGDPLTVASNPVLGVGDDDVSAWAARNAIGAGVPSVDHVVTRTCLNDVFPLSGIEPIGSPPAADSDTGKGARRRSRHSAIAGAASCRLEADPVGLSGLGKSASDASHAKRRLSATCLLRGTSPTRRGRPSIEIVIVCPPSSRGIRQVSRPFVIAHRAP